VSKHLSAIENYDMDSLEKAKLRALILGYFYVYSKDKWYAVDVERKFQIELETKPFKFVGMIDTLVTQEGYGLSMLEHKTTINPLDDLSHPYFRKLSYDLQVSAYHLAQLLMEEELEQTIYDVIRKPQIRPKKITKAMLEEIEDGEYAGLPFTDEAPEIELGQLETPGLYEMRLFSNIIKEPKKYYRRVGGIRRTTEQCQETYKMLNEIADDILECHRRGRWHQNSSACSKYGSPCEYMSICCGVSDPSSDRWKKRQGSDLSGEFNLSVSRIHCFFECRRKYYYRYVEGIERNSEKPLALTFGGAFHECLESFWNSTRKDLEDE